MSTVIEEKRGSEAPANKTPGNIHTQTLKEYIPKRYEFIRVRLRFLGWEVDVELLEVFAGAAVWTVLADMINVLEVKPPHSVYELLWKIMPPMSWIFIAASIGLIHFVAILFDRSAEVDFSPIDDNNAVHLRIRIAAMAFAFLFNFTITASIFMAYTFTLSWKLMAMFTVAAFFSHIRLRKCFTKLVKARKKQKESDTNTC